MRSLPDTIMPIVSVLGFVAMWCLVSLLMAYKGGWALLAARFRAGERPSGVKLSFCAARIGIASYAGILTAIKTETGLYLSALPPWRLAHPPIFIPWSEMKPSFTRSLFTSRWVKIKVSTPAIVTVRLQEKMVAGKLAYA